MRAFLILLAFPVSAPGLYPRLIEANKTKNKPSVKEKWSEDGSTSISPVENQQPADTENISALGHSSEIKDNTNNSNSQENSEKTSDKNSPARTPLSAEEDSAYMDAVERGDEKKAGDMVKEAVRLAMPDTKVVDEDGNPVVGLYPRLIEANKT